MLVAILTTVVTMYLLGGISSKSVTAVVGTVLGVGIQGTGNSVWKGHIFPDIMLQILSS